MRRTTRYNQGPEEKPDSFTSAELAERTLHRRAVEAVIWGMPAVNAELMFQAMRAKLSRPLDFLVITDHAEMYGLMPQLVHS